MQEIELEKNDIILYKAYLKFPYVVVESPQSKRLFLGGIAKKASSKSILLQAEYIFTIIESILEIEKMPISSIVRQWNYIQAITKIDCEHQHYQDFNDARTIFYNKTTWDDGYPAATGIGTSFGGLVIDLEAVLPKGSKVKIRGIDNKLQIPAFDYSQKVLLGKGDEKLRAKSTPKFERAKAVIDNKVGLLYISGTAAIKGETCLGKVDLKEQTLATLENISHLLLPQTLEEAGIDYGCDIRLISLRVYLKKKSFYEDVKKIIDKEYINLEIIYLLADVCRDELLIEIEAMASIGIEA
ncbi:hypothetical protein AwDysgo_13530 [Bacteroidales bacterium]|nr:hypothetical protein AwDysgo_13530 [Bacteroidales bacterium]